MNYKPPSKSQRAFANTVGCSHSVAKLFPLPGVPFSLSLWQTLPYLSRHSLPAVPALCSVLKPLPAPRPPPPSDTSVGAQRTCAAHRLAQGWGAGCGMPAWRGPWHREPRHTCSHLCGPGPEQPGSPSPVGSGTKSSNSSPPPQKTENSTEHKRQNNPVGYTPAGAGPSEGEGTPLFEPPVHLSPGLAWLTAKEEAVLQQRCAGSVEGAPGSCGPAPPITTPKARAPSPPNGPQSCPGLVYLNPASPGASPGVAKGPWFLLPLYHSCGGGQVWGGGRRRRPGRLVRPSLLLAGKVGAAQNHRGEVII